MVRLLSITFCLCRCFRDNGRKGVVVVKLMGEKRRGERERERERMKRERESEERMRLMEDRGKEM